MLIFLRRLGGWAGVEKVKAHRFRHTFATWAIENEARELDVQYLLGHSTPAKGGLRFPGRCSGAEP